MKQNEFGFVEEVEFFHSASFSPFSRPLLLDRCVFSAPFSLPVFVLSSLLLFQFSDLCLFPTGDELLGMDGARYLKLDDFKDQDDDFLSPKKTLRDFEGGMGTT